MLWALIVLILLLAIFGGLFVHPLLFILIVAALVLLAGSRYGGSRRLP